MAARNILYQVRTRPMCESVSSLEKKVHSNLDNTPFYDVQIIYVLIFEIHYTSVIHETKKYVKAF